MVTNFKDQASSNAGFIRAYGLFWSAHEVDWYGTYSGHHLELLGRINKQGSSLRVANFWNQQGIYVLYNDYGPYYVGRTSGQQMSLGKRLRHHALGLNGSPHAGKWDRFSWFGWRGVLEGADSRGLRNLRKMPKHLLTNSTSTVNDIEALLIYCFGTRQAGGNGKNETFAAALQWEQVFADEREKYLGRIAP